MFSYNKCSKISNQKRKNTQNLFSLLISEAKRSNKFCKGRQFNWLPLQIGYFRHRIFGIFLFQIQILLYKFLEHKP